MYLVTSFPVPTAHDPGSDFDVLLKVAPEYRLDTVPVADIGCCPKKGTLECNLYGKTY
ncbi:hypothetical protein DPMN_150144 [Dreissena polymorpha]|uniref:Uncharacterized protein n=1 Tax=Dreissena polymorpha TaxID=45954 RepID=A0A9D4FHE1_DREPO|nr:hypothetical protein DPMN_150144 [Dreissena polymorpha]